MNIFACVTYLILFFSTYACGEEYDGVRIHDLFLKHIPYDEAVSLGTSCIPAGALERSNMRKNAYPLDWVVSGNFDGLIKFLVTKGKDFLEQNNLIVQPHNGYDLFVTDTLYGFMFIHDFIVPDIYHNWEVVKSKYNRRIKRLFDLLESNKRILFIRVSITRQEAESLDQVLHSLYPKLLYTLVVANDGEEFKQDWGLKRIRNFYVEFPNTYDKDFKRWKNILSQFPMTPRADTRPPEDNFLQCINL